MDSGSRRKTGTLLVSGIALAAAALVLLAFFVPLAPCLSGRHDSPFAAVGLPALCPRGCRGGRIPLPRYLRESAFLPRSCEGKYISQVTTVGFAKSNARRTQSVSGLEPGRPMTPIAHQNAINWIWDTGLYRDVRVQVSEDPKSPDNVLVTISVREK